MVDESVASDADYIIANIAAGSTCEMALNVGIDPADDTNHVLVLRIARPGMTVAGGDLDISLMQGATVIQSFQSALASSFTDESFNITNAASITNYADLRVRIVNNTLTLQPQISQVYLSTPDVITPPGPEPGTPGAHVCRYYRDGGTGCYPPFVAFPGKANGVAYTPVSPTAFPFSYPTRPETVDPSEWNR
jgi:hypothetical protein